ncbi:glycosyltransferase [Kordia sp.]|uniref:glycosyltransferase n=1 Tax=Kordia sp. TaxID=1965332 RepID=UPI003D285984
MSVTKKKVLLIGIDGLTHYRVEMFNLLCDQYDFTVAHTNDPIDGAKFAQLKVTAQKRGPFFTIKNEPDYSKFDTVICSFNIRILNLYKLLFKKRNFKVLVFGIGVSASYSNNYDSKKRLDFLRKYVIKKSDGAIFYEHYPLIKYQSYGIDSNKLHVAYNTVIPPKAFDFSEKTFESFMFIGTLYKQKKIYELLTAYQQLHTELKEKTPVLEIVGNGEEYDNIVTWIANNGFQEKVILHGKLTEEHELLPIFKRSLACISPGQAGLSVQKCFSYGTPFITTKNAITGGELFCIINKTNGFIYDGSVKALANVMKNIADRTHNIEEISEKAYTFYYNFRTPEVWKNAFINAIA